MSMLLRLVRAMFGDGEEERPVRVGAMTRIMCGLGLVLAAPLMALAPAGASPSAPAADNPLAPVDVVEVSGLIDRISADSIRTSLARSETNGAQAVILQVNTRGAVIGRDAMAALLADIKNSTIPVAIWVGPSGARLYGLPAQMVAVADVAAMAPGHAHRPHGHTPQRRRRQRFPSVRPTTCCVSVRSVSSRHASRRC